MTTWKVRVKLDTVSGVADDQPGFDWVLANGAAPVFASVDGGISDFFNAKFGIQVNSMGAYLSSVVSRAANAAHITIYDITGHLDGSPAGPPIHMHDFTIADGSLSGDSLPRQVCTVLSYHGALGALEEFGPGGAVIPNDDRAQDEGAPATHLGRDRFRSRARGRLFFGPLERNHTMDVDATTKEVSLSAAFAIDIGQLLHGWLAESITDNWPWQVWSRRDAAVRQVTGGFVNSQMATQRRRRIENGLKVAWA